jgi:hypothetical protein
MIGMKKFGGIDKPKPREDAPQHPENDLKFILWKAELNKELMAFWKSMTK